MTDEERDAIYRAYDVETRRGADTLFWEGVVVGEELKPVIVKFATFDDEVNAWKRGGRAFM